MGPGTLIDLSSLLNVCTRINSRCSYPRIGRVRQRWTWVTIPKSPTRQGRNGSIRTRFESQDDDSIVRFVTPSRTRGAQFETRNEPFGITGRFCSVNSQFLQKLSATRAVKLINYGVISKLDSYKCSNTLVEKVNCESFLYINHTWIAFLLHSAHAEMTF